MRIKINKPIRTNTRPYLVGKEIQPKKYINQNRMPMFLVESTVQNQVKARDNAGLS